ncbi:MAG: hypothetical protein BM558_03015 [Roseobacter sp. MedPE-SW]|nr:MAG: hypothetical protein BM558_03015 [Roseobacter sp. MedPE-SW]
MSLRKTLGILVFSTQAVVAVDYNMQSRKAGLEPGELSMSDYAAVVQSRYDTKSDEHIAADHQETGIWQKVTGLGAGLGSGLGAGLSGGHEDLAQAEDAPQEEESSGICIRRGTALNCQ